MEADNSFWNNQGDLDKALMACHGLVNPTVEPWFQFFQEAVFHCFANSAGVHARCFEVLKISVTTMIVKNFIKVGHK